MKKAAHTFFDETGPPRQQKYILGRKKKWTLPSPKHLTLHRKTFTAIWYRRHSTPSGRMRQTLHDTTRSAEGTTYVCWTVFPTLHVDAIIRRLRQVQVLIFLLLLSRPCSSLDGFLDFQAHLGFPCVKLRNLQKTYREENASSCIAEQSDGVREEKFVAVLACVSTCTWL